MMSEAIKIPISYTEIQQLSYKEFQIDYNIFRKRYEELEKQLKQTAGA